MATKKTTQAKKKSTSKKSTSSTKATPRKGEITAEQIRLKAAQIYADRLSNGNHGDELSDWLQAEKELVK